VSHAKHLNCFKTQSRRTWRRAAGHYGSTCCQARTAGLIMMQDLIVAADAYCSATWHSLEFNMRL